MVMCVDMCCRRVRESRGETVVEEEGWEYKGKGEQTGQNGKRREEAER
jgi:hypothetical protein